MRYFYNVIMEHPVKSRNWFLKHLWKNETKILFYSRDRRFWRFWKVLVLRLPNCLDTRQRLKYMTHHTWRFFFSKAICQPSFSYIMNHGNSTQIVFGESWWSLKRFEQSCVSNWAEIGHKIKAPLLSWKHCITIMYNSWTYN